MIEVSSEEAKLDARYAAPPMIDPMPRVIVRGYSANKFESGEIEAAISEDPNYGAQ